jgi:hypothetical protein
VKRFDSIGQDGGFTMIEGLVAGGILAGILPGISGLQTTPNVDSKGRTMLNNSNLNGARHRDGHAH